MRRKEVLIAVVGGVVGAFLTMLVGSFSPLGAQSQGNNTEFNIVTCRELKVVDEEGNTKVAIDTDEDGGYVAVRSKDGKGWAAMSINERGGNVGVYGKDNKLAAAMSIDDDGGLVSVLGKDGNSAAKMSSDEHGGEVGVYRKDGSRAVTMLTHDEYGGHITLYDNASHGIYTKNEKGMFVPIQMPRLFLGVNEHGGYLNVLGELSNTKATMGVDERGNGKVSVWQGRWFSSKGEWKDAFGNAGK